MRIRESFELPGLSSPETVIHSYDTLPRQMTLVGLRFDIALRVIAWLAGLALAFVVIYHLMEQVLTGDALIAWAAIIGILPLILFWFPWFLSHRLVQRYRAFEKCRKIYQNGILTRGNVVMMSLVCGNDYACYYAQPKRWALLLSKRIRVDYTFGVDNELKTGSVFIRQRNARYLAANDEICVIYDPENPAKNMLFPIPGEEMCGCCLK